MVDHKKIVFVLSRVGDCAVELNEGREYLQQAGFEISEGELPNKVGYRRALDIGRTVNETKHETLNDKAELVVQSVVNKLESVNAQAAQS